MEKSELIEALRKIVERLTYLDDGVEPNSPADDQISEAFEIANDIVDRWDREKQ